MTQRNSMPKAGALMTVFALLLNYAAMAQTVNKFTVEQTVAYGAKNAVQVKNALLDVSMQKQINREITAAALPDISVNGSFTDYLDIPTTLLPGEIIGQPPGTFTPVKFGTKYIVTGGGTLKQTIFDGQVFTGLQARQTAIDAKKVNADFTQQNVKAGVYKTYYLLVVSKTQIDLLDANILRLQKLEHDTREIYKNGFAEKLDVDKLTVQIANLQSEKQKVLTTVKNGYSNLKLLIGMPLRDSLVLADTLSDSRLRADILEVVQYQYKDRKDYQLLELNSKLNEYNIKRYKLSQIPTLSFTANWNKQAQRNEFDFTKRNGQWFTTSYIGLNLSFNLFRGFSTKAKIEQAKIELQKTKNQLTSLEIGIDNDVEIAKNNLATALSTMDFQKQNMQLAELVYDQTKKKYEVGTGSATEINAAQTDLQTAQTNYINAIYEAVIARVDLMQAVGKL